MGKIKTLAILNFIFFLVHLLPSQLTQFRLINEQTIGEVSNKYPTLFTPAGITFAIWGIIYLSLTAFCIYHLIKAFRTNITHEANEGLHKMGYLLVLNNLATGLWTIAWIYEKLILSVLLMLVQLVTLLLIQIKLGIFNPHRSTASSWFTHFPLSIYFGWICIATVANISAALVGFGWNGFGLSPALWNMLMITAATFITLFVIRNRRNPFVGLVSIWAFYGIILKHQALKLAVSSGIIIVCWISISILIIVTAFQFYQNIVARKLHYS